MKANKHLATVMAATMVAGSVVPVMAETTNEALIGKNRIETAVKISKDGWNSAETVILVNDGAIADALTATPLAFAKNAPILLTSKNGLSAQVKAEIKRLDAKNVILIGGNTVLPASIEKELKELGLKPDRIKGDTREETALAIAKRLDAISDVSEIAVVNGTKGLADAVSVAAAAAERHMPILLANPKKGLSASEKFIKDEAIKASYLIGGTTVLPNKMVSSLPGKKRLEGLNRNDTNAKVIETFYKGKELKNVYVAKDGRGGDSQLIDALAVGVLAAKNASPVLIASKNLNAKQVNVINTKEVSNIVQVGGKGNEGAFNHLKEIEKEDVYEVGTVEELKEALEKANANDKIVLKPNATITEDIIINTDKNVDIKVEGTVTGKVEITAPNGNVANNSTSKPETNKPSGGGTTTPSVDQNKVNLVNAAKAAKDYKYEGENIAQGENKYKYTGEITVTGKESANVNFEGPYKAINLSSSEKKAAMNDMARYLGALHRNDKGASIKSIEYNGKIYKWSNKLTLKGSNWVIDVDSDKAEKNTLVSNIVADANGEGTINLVLVDANGNKANLTINFKSTLPAKVNDVYYKTLVEAVETVANSSIKKGEIKLTKDFTGGGIGLFYDKGHKNLDLTIDLCNYTYTVSEPAVGSKGYETQAFHLEKDNNVTIKNGKINVAPGKHKMYMLFQNYCNLTLENLDLQGGEETYCMVATNYGKSKISNVSISNPNYKKENYPKVENVIAVDVDHNANYSGVNNPNTVGLVITNKLEKVIDGEINSYCSNGSSCVVCKDRFKINSGKFINTGKDESVFKTFLSANVKLKSDGKNHIVE